MASLSFGTLFLSSEGAEQQNVQHPYPSEKFLLLFARGCSLGRSTPCSYSYTCAPTTARYRFWFLL